MLLCRNRNTYENPEAFCPNRWDNASKEMQDGHLPFSFGKQNCIGQSLATAEIYTVAARIFSEFDLEIVEEGHVDFFLTLKPVGALLKARPGIK